MPASLSHVLVDFQSGIDSSVNLISAVRNLGINRIQLEIITELAFLRVFIAWENFLEGSFIRYSIGASSLLHINVCVSESKESWACVGHHFFWQRLYRMEFSK